MSLRKGSPLLSIEDRVTARLIHDSQIAFKDSLLHIDRVIPRKTTPGFKTVTPGRLQRGGFLEEALKPK